METREDMQPDAVGRSILRDEWENGRRVPQGDPFPIDLLLRVIGERGAEVYLESDGEVPDGPCAGGLVIAVQEHDRRHYEVSPAGLHLLRAHLTDEAYREMVRRAPARWSEG